MTEELIDQRVRRIESEPLSTAVLQRLWDAVSLPSGNPITNAEVRSLIQEVRRWRSRELVEYRVRWNFWETLCDSFKERDAAVARLRQLRGSRRAMGLEGKEAPMRMFAVYRRAR